MDNFNDIVKLAVDAYKGNVTKYSANESMDVLRQALIEANNGSTTLNYKAIRDGKCNGLFALVEEILDRTVVDGLQEDEFFMNFVDFRNVAAGDQNVFEVENDILFTVAKAADGTQAIRRQRFNGMTETKIETAFRVVKIYDELNRVLSGRVDFNKMIQKVGESFRQQMLSDIYGLWTNATAAQFGGTTYFPAAGTYDEDDLLSVIEHVEAAAGGKPATLIGTKAALRAIAPSVSGINAQNDLYSLGYYGNFYGSNVIALPQHHQIGSTNFTMNDKVITVVSGNQKPLKVVYEGDSTMIMGQPTNNMDLTQEYLFGEKWGTGIVLAGGNAGIGRYTMS